MIISYPRLKVNIDLPNGIYRFSNESATGKTRLCKALKTFHSYGEKVNAYTYNDKLDGKNISTVLSAEYKIILLDRYDLYYGDGFDRMKELADNCIILLDCKHFIADFAEWDCCYIKMTADTIEVTDN